MPLQKLILVIFSSLLYAMAQPNEFFHYGSTMLGFIALIPFFHTLFTCGSLKESILAGAVFGLLSTSMIYFWLLFFEDFSVWTLSGVVAAHTLYFIILSPFITLTGKYGTLRPFLTAAVWIGYEYLKSIGYAGFPWGLMAQSTGIAPFVQIADITGQWGISFLIVLFNTMILETILIKKKRLISSWIFTAVLMIGSISYGIYINHKEIPWENSINVLMVQQDADSWSKTVSGETQHLAAARLRTIENRRSLIRSTNAGVTTVIDPLGRMNYTLPLFQADTVTAQIPLYEYKGYTVYTILGDWFPILLIIVISIYLFFGVYVQKRRGRHAGFAKQILRDDPYHD